MSNDALADVLDLAIAGVRELHPYVGPPPVDQISLESGQPLTRLASNESPLGPGPLVREALNRFEDLSRYPDGGAVQLRQALAKHSSLQVEQIIMGNGSNEILELVARVFSHAGAQVCLFRALLCRLSSGHSGYRSARRGGSSAAGLSAESGSHGQCRG